MAQIVELIIGFLKTPGAVAGVRKVTSESKEEEMVQVSVVSNCNHPTQLSEHVFNSSGIIPNFIQ